MDDEQVKIHIQNQQCQEELQKLYTDIHPLESENKMLRVEISVFHDEMRTTNRS